MSVASAQYTLDNNSLQNDSKQDIQITSDSTSASGKTLTLNTKNNGSETYDILSSDNGTTAITSFRFWFGAKESDITSGQAKYKIRLRIS